MLSYQHAFHAGNLADVHKHALLAVALEYLTQKDKPLSYIETHAGRGLYTLNGEAALKTGEAAGGIARLEAGFPLRHAYRQRLVEARAQNGPDAYPGSPLIAALSLRPGDTMHLAELHPQEHAALATHLAPWGAHVRRQDGLEMAQAITPPTPRRGLMLIDPSYEVKDDYTVLPKVMQMVHRKWNVGILMLWYPVLTAPAHEAMLRALATAFPGAMRQEVMFPPVRDRHRMVGSGVFIVNPPYGLADEAARLDAMFATLEVG